MDTIEEVDDEVESLCNDERNDMDYMFREQKRGKSKLDVMEHVSATADRLGLSIRKRCTMAASLGVDIDSAVCKITHKE